MLSPGLECVCNFHSACHNASKRLHSSKDYGVAAAVRRMLAASSSITGTKKVGRCEKKQRHKLGVDVKDKGGPAEWPLFLRNEKGG